VFDRTYEFVQKAKLESPYFSILTPYPGTRLYQRLLAEGRIIDRDWSNYNTNNVVFAPRGMSAPAALRRLLPAAERGAHRSRPSRNGSGDDGESQLLAAHELRVPAIHQEADRPRAGVPAVEATGRARPR